VGVESCENPKSPFEINPDIPSETERNPVNFSASGTVLFLLFVLFVGRFAPDWLNCSPVSYNEAVERLQSIETIWNAWPKDRPAGEQTDALGARSKTS